MQRAKHYYITIIFEKVLTFKLLVMIINWGGHQDGGMERAGRGSGDVLRSQISQVTVALWAPALAGDLPNLELGEGPIGSFIEV